MPSFLRNEAFFSAARNWSAPLVTSRSTDRNLSARVQAQPCGAVATTGQTLSASRFSARLVRLRIVRHVAHGVDAVQIIHILREPASTSFIDSSRASRSPASAWAAEARAARLRGDLVLDLLARPFREAPERCGRRSSPVRRARAVDGRHLGTVFELAWQASYARWRDVQGRCDTTEQRCDNECQSKGPRSVQEGVFACAFCELAACNTLASAVFRLRERLLLLPASGCVL